MPQKKAPPLITQRRRCPRVGDSRDTSRPIVPTLHKELCLMNLFAVGGRNLDLGGGKYEKATRFLRTHGVKNMVVDPSRGDAHNDAVWRAVRQAPPDTVTVANVLNVICDAKVRQKVIGMAAGAVRKGGLVAFQVYVGDRSGAGCATADGWQENRKPDTYLPEIARWFKRVERLHGNLFLAWEPRRRPVGKIPPAAPMKTCVRAKEKTGARTKTTKRPGASDDVRANPRRAPLGDDAPFQTLAQFARWAPEWGGRAYVSDALATTAEAVAREARRAGADLDDVTEIVAARLHRELALTSADPRARGRSTDLLEREMVTDLLDAREPPSAQKRMDEALRALLQTVVVMRQPHERRGRMTHATTLGKLYRRVVEALVAVLRDARWDAREAEHLVLVTVHQSYRASVQRLNDLLHKRSGGPA